MIQTRQITKAYKQLKVLKGIDLNIAQGEIVSIVGASGAGKSTLLHILGTLDQPDTGTVQIVGKDLMKLSDTEKNRFRNQHIGFVFQFHNLLPEFSALENVCMPAWLNKQPDKATKQRATELLHLLGLQDRMQHLPAELSGGEQQRTAVARALVNQPDVILADEPSGNLDSKNAQELHQLFFQLRDLYKQTFVIVTHNPTLAEMAARKIVLQDGLLVS
ncbi:MAG: ABC transporter ATP-binding protein [Thermonemataceae bacterium]